MALSAVAITFAATAGEGAAQTVVPGPWGQIVDTEKPLTFASDKARITYFRRNQMRAISGHFRSVEAVITYGAPFAENLRHDAQALVHHAEMMEVLFPAGTELDGGSFGAKLQIWREPDKFAQHVAGFRVAVSALAQSIANKGDVGHSLTRVRHECLACHQSYRVYTPVLKP